MENIGPLGYLPTSPWFPGRRDAARGGSQQPAPNFSVTQKVVVKQQYSANPGVLVSGRRPDRPGR